MTSSRTTAASIAMVLRKLPIVLRRAIDRQVAAYVAIRASEILRSTAADGRSACPDTSAGPAALLRRPAAAT